MFKCITKRNKSESSLTTATLVIFTNCSLTLREVRRLMVFENRVLRRIFGAKRDEVREEWRNLHKVELNDLYCSLNIYRVIKSRKVRWAGHVARMGVENFLQEFGGET